MAVSSVTPSISTIEATGGDEVYFINQGGLRYKVHKFTEPPPPPPQPGPAFEVLHGEGTVEYLLIGGGAGGGGTEYRGASGGGAGAVVVGSLTVTPQVYPIIVGMGGAGSPQRVDGQDGEASSLNQFVETPGGVVVLPTVEAIGGGGGGYSRLNVDRPGRPGASGGGGIGRSGPGAATPFVGRIGTVVPRNSNSGGTGGGLSLPLSFDGFEQTYAIGGRAGIRSSQRERTQIAALRYGEGGSGAFADSSDPISTSGGAGGSGVVIIRYPVARL